MSKVKSGAGARPLQGVGQLPVQCSVFMFFVQTPELMSEVEWVKLGRPLGLIRYGIGGGELPTNYVYCRTMVPACVAGSFCLTCPSNTLTMEFGVSVAGVEHWQPMEYRQVASQDDGEKLAAKASGRRDRWRYWDYSVRPETGQQYLIIDTGDATAEPQFAPDHRPAPKRTRARKRTKRATVHQEAIGVDPPAAVAESGPPADPVVANAPDDRPAAPPEGNP